MLAATWMSGLSFATAKMTLLSIPMDMIAVCTLGKLFGRVWVSDQRGMFPSFKGMYAV